jgi:hypothetical protein
MLSSVAMNRSVALSLALIAVVGCSRKKADGLAPGSSWQADPSAMAPDDNTPLAPHGGTGPVNPHEGLDMSQVGGGQGETEDPHAGMAGGNVDVTKTGLVPPDPNRKIDTTKYIRGTLTVDPKAAEHVTDGGAVFLVVKRPGPDGKPSGTPLAVEKMSWKNGEGFELTDQQAMVAGTELTGEVIVTARFDHDGDALSKQPGDVSGSARVTLPAENVKLVLDTVQQ